MIKDTRYIIKRVIIGVLISLILSFIYSCNVKAIALDTELLVNNTALTGKNKLYNAGNQNVTIKISEKYDTVHNAYTYYYGYIAICSGTAKGHPILAVNYNNNLFNSAVAYTSNETCTIPGTSAYNDTARVVYITFNFEPTLMYTDLSQGAVGFAYPPEFSIWQDNATEYALVGYGFSNNAYQVNSDAPLNETILNSIYQRLVTIDGDIATLNGKIDYTNGYLVTINGNITVTHSKIDLVNSRLATIISDLEEFKNDLIESQQVCEDYDNTNIKVDNAMLNDSGQEYSTTLFGISDYIKVIKSEVKIYNNINFTTGASICFYTKDKTKISCIKNNNITGDTIDIPNNAYYMRFSINKNTGLPQIGICRSGNQASTDAINGVNDTLNDSNVDDASSSLSDMDSKIASNSVISDLLLLPVSLFQRVNNNINGTCSSFNLGSLLGTSLVFPCINLQNIIGSNLYGIIDILLCGIFVLSMRKRFVDIFENITSLKDRGNELE